MKIRELTKLLESERAHSADLQQTIRKFRSALEDMKDQNEQLKDEAKTNQERGEGDGSEALPDKPVDITEAGFQIFTFSSINSYCPLKF